MSASPKPSSRLTRLYHILSQSPAPASPESDPLRVHLTSVPLERIRALTTELQEPGPSTPDDIDAITMRVLLNDYRAAVSHLRAVTNGVDSSLHHAWEEMRYFQKKLRHEAERAAKHGAPQDPAS
jgi:hypothetical protein